MDNKPILKEYFPQITDPQKRKKYCLDKIKHFVCPSCGFSLRGYSKNSVKYDPRDLPKYCSECGLKLNWDGLWK